MSLRVTMIREIDYSFKQNVGISPAEIMDIIVIHPLPTSNQHSMYQQLFDEKHCLTIGVVFLAYYSPL